jgi:hypothetical protein
MCPICFCSPPSSFFFFSSSLYSICSLKPHTSRSPLVFLFCFHSASFAVAVLFYSLLAPGTFIGLTRLLLWLSLYRTTMISLSLSASSVHTFGGCCVRIPLPDNSNISLSIRIQCPHLWRALRPYPFTGQQQFSLLYVSVFQFPYPPPIPFSCLVSFGTVAPVKNKLFRYREDGSKKLNACNQFFLCMVYF